MNQETRGLPFDVVCEVIAKGDVPVVNEDGNVDPHRVKFGKGQRSGLSILLRALEASKRGPGDTQSPPELIRK